MEEGTLLHGGPQEPMLDLTTFTNSDWIAVGSLIVAFLTFL